MHSASLTNSTSFSRASYIYFSPIQIGDHVGCAMAGITADANILIDKARLDAQRYELK